MNRIERIFNRIMYGKPDYSIRQGDIVTATCWDGPVKVVSVNWALRAAAVELSPGNAIIVWPVGCLTKVAQHAAESRAHSS